VRRFDRLFWIFRRSSETFGDSRRRLQNSAVSVINSRTLLEFVLDFSCNAFCYSGISVRFAVSQVLHIRVRISFVVQ
jgi:hypothetical protein